MCFVWPCGAADLFKTTDLTFVSEDANILCYLLFIVETTCTKAVVCTLPNVTFSLCLFCLSNNPKLKDFPFITTQEKDQNKNLMT